MGRLRLGAGVAVLLVLLPAVASAYGLWTARRAGEMVIVYGKGAADRVYDPAAIRSVIVLDAAGQAVPAAIEPHPNRATIRAGKGAALFVVDADMGVFSRDAAGYWRKGTKDAVRGATLTQRFLKHAVSITHLHGALPPLPPQPLQILPLSNPAEAAAGETVRVRVLFDGRPLGGAAIVPDYVNAPREVLGRTDENGEADLFIRNDGLNVAAVIHLVKTPGDPHVDQVEHVATLSFPAHQPHSH